MKKTLALLSAAFSLQTFAIEVVIEDTRCVSADAARVHEVTIDYDRYSASPGAKFTLPIPMFGKLPLLAMIKSQSKFSEKSTESTKAAVWVVLQPSNLSDSTLYPRFLMECTSNFDTSEHFMHSCQLIEDKPHFGLQGFSSILEVTQNSERCSNGKTLLVYRLRLDSNDSEVAMIKASVLAPAGPLAPRLAEIFDERTFFKSYYVNFYNGWVKKL